VCEDFRSLEEAGVCEPVGFMSAAGSAGCTGDASDWIGKGAGMSCGSVTGWTEPGASVEIARDPGEYHTIVLVKPVSMIENIRTSKYDRCSSMLGPTGGSGHPGLRTGVHRTNAKNKLTY
jgi:hypothetical protein